jgi:hypothetical protein
VCRSGEQATSVKRIKRMKNWMCLIKPVLVINLNAKNGYSILTEIPKTVKSNLNLSVKTTQS